jgi:putative SOS response-associated peptidase YedK
MTLRIFSPRQNRKHSTEKSERMSADVWPLRTLAAKATRRGLFDASGEDNWIPRYKIAPTEPIPVIRQHPKEPRRVFSLMRRIL